MAEVSYRDHPMKSQVSLLSNNFKRDKPYSLKEGGTATRIKSSKGGLTGARDGGAAVEMAVVGVAGGGSDFFFFLTRFDKLRRRPV